MLLHDDEMEALEAALSFVDGFSHDASGHSVIHHINTEVPSSSTLHASPSTTSTSAGMSGGGGEIADDELESLLLEVGLSSSPSVSAGMKTEPVALAPSSQAGSPTDSVAISGTAANTAKQANIDSTEQARRGSRGNSQQALSGKTKKRVRLNPNRARDNRKNELAYLRNKVKQMEGQLHSLRQQYIENKDSTNTTTTARSIIDTTGRPPVWRDRLSRGRFYTCDVDAVQWASTLDTALFYFTSGGRIVQDVNNFIAENSDNVVSVEVHGRLRGGKGGFGSLLRSFRVNRSTNQLMCRDLNGRRIATVEEEKKLRQWVQKAAERERQKLEKKKAKIERLKGGPAKHQFNDPDYIEQREQILEKTEEAFEDGFENFKKIREKKKNKEVEESSDSDIDFDDFGQSRKKRKLLTKSDFPEEKKPKLCEKDSSDSTDSENEYDPELIQEIQQYFEEKKPELNGSDEPTSSKASSNENSTETSDKSKKPEIPETFDDIDLKKFNSQEELEELGLDHLKYALKERGLKCGGSLTERASRLFAVRDLEPSKYPKNLLAAKK